MDKPEFQASRADNSLFLNAITTVLNFYCFWRRDRVTNHD